MTARARRVAHLEAMAHAEPRSQPGPMRIALRLPWPPSVNSYWRSLRTGPLAGRVLISRGGRDYRVAVGHEVLRQRIARHQLTGRLGINVMACPPDRRIRDLDNLWKGFLDALTCAGVISDDGDFDDMRIYRGPVVTDGLLHIEIVELPGLGDTLEFPLVVRDPILDQALAIMGAG
jgi:crossover junction endodeoxyribonuclease RusA